MFVPLEANLPQVEWLLKEVAVLTRFYRVPDGMYANLEAPSFVAFLPADRVCVAEPKPNGEIWFRSV